VPHYWNLRDIIGFDLWNTLGFRYVTAIQRPGADFYAKTEADRLRLRPFRLYDLPPMRQPNEDYPIYLADDVTINSRAGQPARTFFAFTTQVIDYTRYSRTDLAWPNNDGSVRSVVSVGTTIDQFQYYTWRLWSSLAPTQIYTHDGAGNMVQATDTQRRQVVQGVSGWLNAEGARHVFMQDLADYMRARTKSVLTQAETLTGGLLNVTFTGNAATADGALISTQFLTFFDDSEGVSYSVPGFTGGGTFTVSYSNPVPATSGLSPASAIAGGAPFTLTVNGTGFVGGSNGSGVRWNGANRTTTFVSSTQVRAAIPSADIATTGTAAVTVVNPTPGGGTSNPQTFNIVAGNNPAPTTTGLAPSSAALGSPGFTLTVNGTNFVAGSQVRWNGANRTTTVLSATQVTAAIPATDLTAAGAASVTVFNPAPGGGLSNAQPFTVTNPVPTIASTTPAWVSSGGPAFTLTVDGSGFVAGSQVRWNGANRATTFVSATQLTAAIAAADIATAGTAQVTVFNPVPGGGTSNAATFYIIFKPWEDRTDPSLSQEAIVNNLRGRLAQPCHRYDRTR